MARFGVAPREDRASNPEPKGVENDRATTVLQKLGQGPTFFPAQVGLGVRELDASLVGLEWSARSFKEEKERRRALSARAVAAAVEEAAADVAALAAVAAELRPPSVAEIEARDKPRGSFALKTPPPSPPKLSPPKPLSPNRQPQATFVNDGVAESVNALVARERESAATSLERAIDRAGKG